MCGKPYAQRKNSVTRERGRMKERMRERTGTRRDEEGECGREGCTGERERERERGEEKRDCEKIEEGKRGEGVLPAVHD